MILSDLFQAGENLKAQKTRTLLTALGIVFGVGSVIGMLAIGAGAREESLSFIEQLGVRNVLVDSRPASTFEELQQRRRSSPGLTERDVRVLQANISDLELISPRRTMRPSRVLPKPAREMPDLYGVHPAYAAIHNLRISEGRFFNAADEARSAPVCVLGQNAKADILGYAPAVGKFVKVNDTWLEVVGVLGEALAATGQTRGGRMEDLNNVIYVPFNTFAVSQAPRPHPFHRSRAAVAGALPIQPYCRRQLRPGIGWGVERLEIRAKKRFLRAEAQSPDDYDAIWNRIRELHPDLKELEAGGDPDWMKCG